MLAYLLTLLPMPRAVDLVLCFLYFYYLFPNNAISGISNLPLLLPLHIQLCPISSTTASICPDAIRTLIFRTSSFLLDTYNLLSLFCRSHAICSPFLLYNSNHVCLCCFDRSTMHQPLIQELTLP